MFQLPHRDKRMNLCIIFSNSYSAAAAGADIKWLQAGPFHRQYCFVDFKSLFLFSNLNSTLAIRASSTH